MGIVAIGALHDTFVYAVLEGHGELGADGSMASVAELGLPLRQNEFRTLRFVNRMAVGADDVVLRMDAAANVGA